MNTSSPDPPVFSVKDKRGNTVTFSKPEALFLLEWLRNKLATLLEQEESSFTPSDIDSERINLDDFTE